MSPGDGSAEAASYTGGRSAGGTSAAGGRSSGGRASGGAAGAGGSTSGGTSGSGGAGTGGGAGAAGTAAGGASGTGGATNTGGTTNTGGVAPTGGAGGTTDSGLDGGAGGRGMPDASSGGSPGCPRTDASIGFRCSGFAGIETYYEVSKHRVWVHAAIAPLALGGRYYIDYRLVSDGTTHCESGDVQAQNGVPYIPWSGTPAVDRFRIGALELVDACGQVYSFTAENGNTCDAVELTPASDASTIWNSSCVNAGAGPCVTPASCI